MKHYPYVVSCDWYSVACLSDWATTTTFKTHEQRRNEAKNIPCSISADTPEELKQLLVDHEKPRSWVGLQLVDGDDVFSIESSVEFNPAYHDAACITLRGLPVAHFFWNPRNKYVDRRSCQAKVANVLLYSSDWGMLFRRVLRAAGWSFLRVVRCDICCDFEYFSNGRSPQWFIRDYLNQRPTASRPSFIRKSSNRFRCAGVKSTSAVVFETVSWGTRDSAVQVNLYNKTQELKSVHDKPYIREKWEYYGLPSEYDGQRFVYRLEFSINASAKFIADKKVDVDKATTCARRLRDIQLEDVEGQLALEQMFSCLLPDYFQFYYLRKEDVKNGTPVRSLSPVVLFDNVDCVSFRLRSYKTCFKKAISKAGKIADDIAAWLQTADLTGRDYEKIANGYAVIAAAAAADGDVRPFTAEDLLLKVFSHAGVVAAKKVPREKQARDLQRYVSMLSSSDDNNLNEFSADVVEIESILDAARLKIRALADGLPDWWFQPE